MSSDRETRAGKNKQRKVPEQANLPDITDTIKEAVVDALSSEDVL